MSYAGSSASYANTITKRQTAGSSYWLANMQHGQMPFAPAGYPVWRNVMDYGAKGDGVTDDTDAINRAVQDGNRCGLSCGSTTTLGAIVFFPPGTYMVSSPIIQYYYTQFIGDPNTKPTIKGLASFKGIALIDTDVYIPGGNGSEWYINQNQFYRQIRNFVIDVTAMPNENQSGDQTFVPTGIHWQVAQSTSLQNIDFVMSLGGGTTAVGLFTENGSGGFMSDLTFFGGNIAMRVGSQQFTARDITITLPSVAVSMIWDWGWTWQNIFVNSAFIAFDCTNFGGLDKQGTGSLTVIDSHFNAVPFAITVTADIQPAITIDNLLIEGNTPSVVLVSGGATILEGTTGPATTIQSWAMGRRYISTDDSGTSTAGNLDPAPNKPAALLDGTGKWFTRSKPQYETISAGSVINVASFGAVGDPNARDQSAALNAAFAAANGAVVFIPAGIYMIANTLFVPPGSRIVGEAWSQLMGFGETFSDTTNPVPVVRVGNPGDVGDVEFSDLMFTAQGGGTGGAVLVEWNIKASSQGSAGMWDCYVRVGGATGTLLQDAECPQMGGINTDCKAASMLMHVTSGASGYFENNWLWVADHEIDNPAQPMVSVLVGRGLLVESDGPTWFWGSASEHSSLYQYQFSNASNIFIGHMQTETPYYQPTPDAINLFPIGVWDSDPTFDDCNPSDPQCLTAWALIIRDSTDIFIYGAGFYSFFSSYSQDCLGTEGCQSRLVQTDFSQGIWMYSQYTKGATECVSPLGGITAVQQADNRNGFLTAISAWLPLALTGANIGGIVSAQNNPTPDGLVAVDSLNGPCGQITCGQTLTLSPTCASAIVALPTVGTNNNPPGSDNCLETCDIYRLITGTCCGTGGSTCFSIEIPPGQDVPAPFPITQGFPPAATFTVPGVDPTGSPTINTYDPTHTPEFPIIIPVGWIPVPPVGPPLVAPPLDEIPDDEDEDAYYLIVLEEHDAQSWEDPDPNPVISIPSPGDIVTLGPGDLGPTPPSIPSVTTSVSAISTSVSASRVSTATSSAPSPTLSSFFFIGIGTEGFGADQQFFSLAWPQSWSCEQVVNSDTEMTLIDPSGNTIQPINFNTFIPGANSFTLRRACGFNEDITLTGSDLAFTGNVGSAHILCERQNRASNGCTVNGDTFAVEPFFNCIVDGSNDFCLGQQQ
ncbi:pectate lyase superfamily protein-domain-containing protein [Xylogone sp. PMI_703]|nr:pectate lyase superfamily protein-domain-containing protein [Xylogone sp. PMI_703]